MGLGRIPIGYSLSIDCTEELTYLALMAAVQQDPAVKDVPLLREDFMARMLERYSPHNLGGSTPSAATLRRPHSSASPASSPSVDAHPGQYACSRLPAHSTLCFALLADIPVHGQQSP